jgi:hypothetical protein
MVLQTCTRKKRIIFLLYVLTLLKLILQLILTLSCEVVRNKAHLVAQGFSQVESLYLGETFAPVAHLEAIRILLAFATSKEFKHYQMNVKSAFLNGVFQEEVFVRQHSGFKNPKYPNRVYKLSKILYRLKQVPRAWYARLKTFLLEHEYVMGSVDKTLFILKHGNAFLLV